MNSHYDYETLLSKNKYLFIGIVLVSIALFIGSWIAIHKLANPGTKVSIFGIFEYVKNSSDVTKAINDAHPISPPVGDNVNPPKATKDLNYKSSNNAENLSNILEFERKLKLFVVEVESYSKATRSLTDKYKQFIDSLVKAKKVCNPEIADMKLIESSNKSNNNISCLSIIDNMKDYARELAVQLDSADAFLNELTLHASAAKNQIARIDLMERAEELRKDVEKASATVEKASDRIEKYK